MLSGTTKSSYCGLVNPVQNQPSSSVEKPSALIGAKTIAGPTRITHGFENRPMPGGSSPNSRDNLYGADKEGFQATLYSVLSSGVLSQSQLMEKSLAYQASDDGRDEKSKVVYVNRLPAVEREELIKKAMEMENNGALTVALERNGVRLDSYTEDFSGKKPDEKLDILKNRYGVNMVDVPEKIPEFVVDQALRDYARRLSEAGKTEAEQRVNSSFLVMARLSKDPKEAGLEGIKILPERERSSILPKEMLAVLVPNKYVEETRQVIAQLDSCPPIYSVESTEELAPYALDKKKNKIDTTGIVSPAYHHGVMELAPSSPFDIHLVKTGLPPQNSSSGSKNS